MYKWENPQQWLRNKIWSITSISVLRAYALILVNMADADDIQNLFAEEMDDDGYFEEVE
jgi:hypothetical protein